MTRTLAIDGGTPTRPGDRFPVFGAPVIEEEEIEEVVRCMRPRRIGTDPKVGEFERAFADLPCLLPPALSDDAADVVAAFRKVLGAR